MTDAVVLGAGASGLTTAVLLAEAGWDVEVWAAEPPERTTSSVASAIWYPYQAAPDEQMLRRSTDSLATFTALASEPGNGVFLREGVELFRGPPPAKPWWSEIVGSVTLCAPDELPPGYGGGWRFTVPVIETLVYLPWLQRRLEAAGGTLVRRRVGSLDEAGQDCGVVVNCTGLAARELVGDELLYPVAGQVVLVENPGLEGFWFDEHHPEGVTYVLPRSSDCVLGGTAVRDSWDTEPDPAVAERIIARCTAIEPRLAGVRVLGHKAGLRPARPTIRLEAETLPTGAVCVHNYGHGGAGITLSWGCAAEAAGMAASTRSAALPRRPEDGKGT
jgi:D-amino-acid oxidase